MPREDRGTSETEDNHSEWGREGGMQGEAGGDRHGNSLQVIEVHKEIKKKKVKQKIKSRPHNLEPNSHRTSRANHVELLLMK